MGAAAWAVYAASTCHRPARRTGQPGSIPFVDVIRTYLVTVLINVAIVVLVAGVLRTAR